MKDDIARGLACEARNPPFLSRSYDIDEGEIRLEVSLDSGNTFHFCHIFIAEFSSCLSLHATSFSRQVPASNQTHGRGHSAPRRNVASASSATGDE